MITTAIAAALLVLSFDNTAQIPPSNSVNQKTPISSVVQSEKKAPTATPKSAAAPPNKTSSIKLPEAIQKLKPQIGATKLCTKCKCDVPKATTLSEKQREYVYSLAAWLEKGEKARPGSSTSRSYVRGLSRLSNIESTHSTLAKNSKSSASGLFGFLDSTWKGTGISKTTCPLCQTRAAIKYCLNRYGSVEGALRHHHATAQRFRNGRPVGGWY